MRAPIRIVTWWGGSTRTSIAARANPIEVPLLTNGTTLSSKAINVDLDITDQTADLGPDGTPQPIKVRILASAIVSVGDTDTLTRTAANRYFAKPEDEQLSTLTDLLSSSGRRAVNLLTHDQLFSAKSAPRPAAVAAAVTAPEQNDALALRESRELVPAGSAADDDDDPLAIIIRKACSRELTDLGLIFNSLNIKVVQSEVADARRRQSAAEATANADIVAAQQAYRAQQAKIAVERSTNDINRELEQTRAANAALVAEADIKKTQAQEIAETKRREAVAEAKANADIVSAQQARRAKEAQLEAERIISDRQRELEQTQLANAALVAEAEAKKQNALGHPARGRVARHADRPGHRRRRARAHRRAGQGAGGSGAPSRRSPKRTRKASARSTRRLRRAGRVTCVTGRWRCCRGSPRRWPMRWRRPGS